MHSKMLAMLEPKDAAQESIMDAVRALSGDSKQESAATTQPAGQMTVASAIDYLQDELHDLGYTFNISIEAECRICGKIIDIDPAELIDLDSAGADISFYYCGGGPSCCP